MTRNFLIAFGTTALLAAACSSPPVDDSIYTPNGSPTGPDGTNGTFAKPTDPNASKPADGLQACATQTAAAEGKPLYLVFAYDQSGSMAASSKWSSAKAAMKGFFSGPDTKGISASMTLFPQFNSAFCDPLQYASPAVPMAALPSAAFGSALDATEPDPGQRGTPTLAALTGALGYAKILQKGTAKDGTVAVVMVTDGIPESCSDSRNIGPAANVASANADTIPTYVVGVGNNLNDLNDLAAAGGTKAAFIVSSSNPAKTQADLTAAFNQIKLSALTCDYRIPSAPAGQTFDRSKVNVQYAAPGSAASPLAYNPQCTGGTGWKYDDANNPTRILACDGTCDTIKASAGKVDIVFGCETRTASVN